MEVWGNIEDFKMILDVNDEVNDTHRTIMAYEIDGLGVVMAFYGHQNQKPFSSSVFVAGATIEETKDTDGDIISRKVVKAV